MALSWAETLGSYNIFIGANQVDYSGYPDCRQEYLESFEKLANLATKVGVNTNEFKVHAPLLNLSKKEIIQLGNKLGVNYSKTSSCYSPNENGSACGLCSSCVERAQGFMVANLPDPTYY